MSTLADRVTALANTDVLPALKIAMVASAVAAIQQPLPNGADDTFKAVNASRQLGLAVIKDPDTYITQAWLVIVASDDPLATTDTVTDDLVTAAVTAAWSSLAGA